MRRSMADMRSRSARIFSSADTSGGRAARYRLEPADLTDAQPRRLADRDLRLVERDPALDRIELAQRRAVQVDLGDHVGLGHRHVYRCGDADAGFEHAADHALDLVQRGDV